MCDDVHRPGRGLSLNNNNSRHVIPWTAGWLECEELVRRRRHECVAAQPGHRGDLVHCSAPNEIIRRRCRSLRERARLLSPVVVVVVRVLAVSGPGGDSGRFREEQHPEKNPDDERASKP